MDNLISNNVNTLDRPIFISREGSVFKLSFSYDPKIVNMVKELPYSRWDSENRVWVVDITQEAVDSLRNWFVSQGLTDVCVDELINDSEEIPIALPAVLRQGSVRRPYLVTIGIKSDGLFNRLKTIQGAQWEKSAQALSYPPSAAAALADLVERNVVSDPHNILSPSDITITFDARTGIFKVNGDPRAESAFNKSFPSKDVYSLWREKGFDVGFTDPFSEEVYFGEIARGNRLNPVNLKENLFDYQAESVAIATKRTGFAIWDQPGLGKCVHPETRIIINRENISIEDFFDQNADLTSRVTDLTGGAWFNLNASFSIVSSNGKKLVECAFNKIFRQFVKEHLKVIYFTNGEQITCTQAHRFLTSNHLWTSSVKEGEAVYAVKNNKLALTSISKIEYIMYEGFVYDVEVPNYSCYVANSIITHNTAQAIAWGFELIHNRNEADRCVIVTPGAVKTQFAREIQRFTGDSDIVVIDGDRKKRSELYSKAHDCKWVVLNYDLLHLDSKMITPLVVNQLLVADEAHRLKNRSSKRTQAMRNLALKASRRLALSGTPVENDPAEWYTIMSGFVVPGIFGSPLDFFNRYSYPGRFGGFEGARNLAELRDRSKPHYIRHLKKDVASFLPELRVQNLILDPDDKFASALKKAHISAQDEITSKALSDRNFGLLDGDLMKDIENGAAMTAVGMLRILCTSPKLLYRSSAPSAQALCEAGLIPDVDGPKVDEIRTLAKSMQEANERLVVFTSFKSMANLVAERFQEDGVRFVLYTGDTSSKDRDKAALAFTTPYTDIEPGPTVFLATDAASEGLNLGKCCSTLVNLDLPFKPSTLIQRGNRIHRVDGDVSKKYLVINYTMSRTIEEGIIKLIGSKADLSDAILGEQGTRKATTGRAGRSVFEEALHSWSN